MKKILLLVLAFIVFSSHDMFLKLDSYFLAPNASSTIKLYNGTFDLSENVIARNRMIDVSLVQNGNRVALDTTQWFEKDSMTILNFNTGDEGTYLAGVSTKARNIELDAEAFNSYLEHDGVKDMLAWRKENNALDQDAIEKYSKHVKTIFQVGNKKTSDWNTILGYPIEFVPLSNPYEKHTGEELKVQLLLDGKPLANQLVYVDYKPSAHGHSHAPTSEEASDHEHGDDDHAHQHEENEEAHTHGSDEHTHADGSTHSHGDDEEAHSHEDGEEHTHDEGTQLKTDQDGKVNVELSADGIWYLRTIHMIASNEPGLTHESNWATLTFEVTHDHGPAVADHVHEEELLFGVPSYVYWIGSAALVGILFFWFYRKG